MKGKYTRKKQQNRVKFQIWLVLLLLVVLIGSVGLVAAKYVQSETGQMMVKAPEFYFTSDLLGEKEQSYVLNSNVREVTFVLRNRADELRISEVPIIYTVTTTGGALSTAEGTLSGAQTDVTVTLSDMQPGTVYEVTATGNAGYTQTLRAKFKVSDQDENVYRHLEVSKDGYMILTVWTNNVAGSMTVGFPAELIPDNTNPHMEAVFNQDDPDNNSFATTVEAYTSQTYRFFHNGGTYKAEQFPISVTDAGETTYQADTADLP